MLMLFHFDIQPSGQQLKHHGIYVINLLCLGQLKKALPENIMNRYVERALDEDLKLANIDNLIR